MDMRVPGEKAARESIVEAFERQVDTDPGHSAFRLTDRGASDVSFGQLDVWANAIAWSLIRRRGTRPEPVPLAVCEPDLMLAAALGVLKAGKFYAAVNPMHPSALVQGVLDELGAPLLLCDRRGESAARRGRVALSVEELLADRMSDMPSGSLSGVRPAVLSSSEARPNLRFNDTRLAYVLYTSGSTGRPRGVAQSQRDMLHNVARHRPLAVGREDCVTLLSADGFVASVSNPYVALLGGAALAPYSFRDAGVEGMVRWLWATGTTVLYAFPSFLRQLAALESTQTHRALRLAYLGGETVLAADLAAARRLFPAATLSTGLNSSETGLTCLHLIAPGADLPDPVPVGRPVSDVEVAILDESGRPAPGRPGELAIRSEYVRPRYWRRDGSPRDDAPTHATAHDGAPAHASAYDDGAPAQSFRTGDYGRIDADGIVYHLGRMDGMVKIRGFRVETSEVEAVIAALPEVAEVAVFAAGDDPSDLELAAWVVAGGAGAAGLRASVVEQDAGVVARPDEGVAARQSAGVLGHVGIIGQGTGIDPSAVRSAVARRLPPAAIPTRVRVVEALPRTHNGKLDRKRLAQLAVTGGPDPVAVTEEPDAAAGTPLAEGEARIPLGAESRAAVERRIVEIWCSELGVESVAAGDDFFALGGTSIVAVAIAARVRGELGVPVPLAVLFKTPTVRALAASVIELGRESSTADVGTESLLRELIALQAPLRAMPLVERRRQYERAERVLGTDSASPGEMIDAGGCAAEWVLAQRDSAQPVVVYLHGGGYSLGSPRSHRHLATAIGRAADAAVLSVDYRRAPEFAFPAAVDDAVAATRWLLGRSDAPVVLAGDSAGGGLVVAALVVLRGGVSAPARHAPQPHAEAPLPVAGVCLSPWVDLTCTADAHRRLARRDPLLSSSELKQMAGAYLRETDPRHPLASPVFADLTGLPPLLIQVGTDEILLDDARRLADTARGAGVEVTLEEWPEMIHTWQWYFPVLEDGRRAVANCAAFIRCHARGELLAENARQSSTKNDLPMSEPERTLPASLIQEAHLQIVPATSGRGYLSWVYQLNGPLDARALTLAVDDVVRRHELLRARFERGEQGTHLAVAPFVPGALELVDLSHHTKRSGLAAAIKDVETVYGALRPAKDICLRATLYRVGPKTSVLAMFVAEALVDSDSGSLLTGAISRAYAAHAGTAVPEGLPAVSDASHLDYIASHPLDPVVLARAREHWARQAAIAPTVSGWPMTANPGETGGSIFAFKLAPAEWARVTSHAHALSSTPYVFVLTCLQVALMRAAHVTRCLAHSIVSERSEQTKGMIGNFHSLVRLDLRLDPQASFKSAAACTAAAVGQAIEHCVVPAPLTAIGTLAAVPSGDLLPGIRFYMFSNHEGPVFAGIRRRRFRLHGKPRAPLTLSCVYGPGGRQDFVFSSTTASYNRLQRLAVAFRVAMHAAPVDHELAAMR